MRRVGVFVDAGYFWVQATHVIWGERSTRSSISVDYAALHKALLDAVRTEFPTADLLRVYWYDGPGIYGKPADHRAIDQLDDFKLRLGTRNTVGSQKAVDGLIIADLISLAQAKAVTDALLMSGDADLVPGMIAAQGLGIRVHLLSMGPAAATSPLLSADSDRKMRWEDEVIQRFACRACRSASPMSTSAAAPTLAIIDSSQASVSSRASDRDRGPVVEASSVWPVTETGGLDFDALAEAAIARCSPAEAATIAAAYSVPSKWDKRLIAASSASVGRELSDEERRKLRTAFKRSASAVASASSTQAP